MLTGEKTLQTLFAFNPSDVESKEQENAPGHQTVEPPISTGFTRNCDWLDSQSHSFSFSRPLRFQAPLDPPEIEMA